MNTFTRGDKDAFCSAPFFQGLPQKTVHALFDVSDVVTFSENTFVSSIGDTIDTVFFVLSGLLRVSACAESGRRVTFLLVKKTEPYNLLGAYLKQPRFLEVQAIKKTRCLKISGKDYLEFVSCHPLMVANILNWVGRGVDSANSRILDLMEKKVENRVLRVVATLHEKFGSPLLFTSQEISEIAGTTPESTLRTMGLLRRMDIIATERGKIWVQDISALRDIEFGNLRI